MNAQTSSTLPVAVVNITDLPGSNTYFRTSDVTPFVDEAGLHIYNARGQSRSWGTPKVTSIVKPLAENVVAVYVTGWHKHTVGPVGGSFYFVREGDQWVRRTANAKAVKAVLN
jgi:hypothetical protein